MFLRCIEANLLSDMTLQGIEAIAKVCTLIQLLVYLFLLKMSTYKNCMTSKACLMISVWLYLGVHALAQYRGQEEDLHYRGGRV